MYLTLLPYAGGKRRFMEDIISPHLYRLRPAEFREPFVGGGSAFLNREERNPIWINDAYPPTAALWTVLLQRPQEFLDRIKKVGEPSKELHEHFQSQLQSTDMMELAVAMLYARTWGFKGIHGGTYAHWWIVNRWNRFKFIWKIERVIARLDYFTFKYRECTCLDFGAVINKDDANYFLDPPYLLLQSDANTNALYGPKFRYRDHLRLAELLDHAPRWVLTYNDCPEVRRWYEGIPTYPYTMRSRITQEMKTELCIVKAD